MILATTTVEDVDQFLKVFGTEGADKRALHGSKGSTVFRDPTEEYRMWVLFEWNEQGWARPAQVWTSTPPPSTPAGKSTLPSATPDRGQAAPARVV
jgi:hypothetical protein